MKSFAPIALLASFTLLSACSGPTEDVRVSFCKDLTMELLGNPEGVEWGEADNDMPRFKDLTMTLGYTAADKKGGVVCVYELEQQDESFIADLQPLDAYATLPHKVVLNDQPIGKQQLAKTIEATMIRQGEELLEKIRQGANKTASQLSQGLQKALNQ